MRLRENIQRCYQTLLEPDRHHIYVLSPSLLFWMSQVYCFLFLVEMDGANKSRNTQYELLSSTGAFVIALSLIPSLLSKLLFLFLLGERDGEHTRVVSNSARTYTLTYSHSRVGISFPRHTNKTHICIFVDRGDESKCGIHDHERETDHKTTDSLTRLEFYISLRPCLFFSVSLSFYIFYTKARNHEHPL